MPEVAAPLGRGLGVDPGPVRVHTGVLSAAAAAELGVRAFTWGVHVYLGQGERPTDLPLLAHEVTHAVQQSGGPAIHLFDGPHGGLEHEARASAAAVVRGQRAVVRGRTSGAGLQGLFDWARRGLRAVGGAISSAASAVADVGAAIRDRVMRFIKDHARSIPGYDLLGFILGRDPITQQPVERNALNLIRGIIGLIPGGAAMFENLQKANVIQRASDWFSAEITKLNITWPYIRGLFSQAWDALSITDLASPSGAWEKLKNIFGPPLARIGAFALAAGRKVLEFIFEGALALAGGAGQQILAIFRRIGATFSLIVSNPLQFLGNLVNAVKGGFQQFKANILQHLKTGIFEWLVGEMRGMVQLPTVWDFAGIVSLILQILGLTYSALREILVKIIGEPAVKFLEGAFEFLKIIVTKGLPAAWEKIKEFAAGIVDTVISGIRDWVVTKIVTAAVTKLATLFNPVGAIIQGIITIYNTVMFFIERAKQIARLVNAILDSIENIARGNIGPAIAYVEKTMASALAVIISFLARLIGLGGVTNAVRDIITKIRATIANALEKVALWIKDKVKGLLAGRKEATVTPADKSAEVRRQAMIELQQVAARGITADQEENVVRGILNRLRGRGLDRLDLGPQESDGTRLVSAAASDFLPLAKFAPKGTLPAGRKVVLYSEIRFSEPTEVGQQPLPALDEEGKPLPLGALSVPVRRKGAGAVLAQPTPTAVRTTTWNTANLKKEQNLSHAEHHFVSWLEGQKSLLPQIVTIHLNLDPYSPCGDCTTDLINLLNRISDARGRKFERNKRDAVLTWLQPYRWTYKHHVEKLIEAGWAIYAPPIKEESDDLRQTQIIIWPPNYKPPG